jgi:hypothetical protein
MSHTPFDYELTYSSEYVLGLLDVAGAEFPRTVVVIVGPGETAWNPASTSNYFYFGETFGDGQVFYTEYQDGGITASV